MSKINTFIPGFLENNPFKKTQQSLPTPGDPKRIPKAGLGIFYDPNTDNVTIPDLTASGVTLQHTNAIDQILEDEGEDQGISNDIYMSKVTDDGMLEDEVLQLVHRYMLMGSNTKSIAGRLKIPPEKASRLIKAVRKKIRAEAQDVDMPGLIGDSLAFYSAVRSTAMHIANTASLPRKVGKEILPPDNKMLITASRALRAALAAENEKNDYLARIGVYSQTFAATISMKVTTALNEGGGASSAQALSDFVNFLRERAIEPATLESFDDSIG